MPFPGGHAANAALLCAVMHGDGRRETFCSNGVLFSWSCSAVSMQGSSRIASPPPTAPIEKNAMRAGAEGRGRARRTQSEKSIFKRQKSLLGDPESKIPSEKVSTLSLLLLLCAVTVRKHWELRGPGGGGQMEKQNVPIRFNHLLSRGDFLFFSFFPPSRSILKPNAVIFLCF